MKKNVIKVIVGAAAAAMIYMVPVQAEEAPASAEVVYTTDYLNVRDEPSLDSEVLFVLEPNTPLYRVDEGDDFDAVTIENQIFYLSNDYLRDFKYSDSDLRALAAIIYEEAGNQCLAGQQAVGIVVMNRVRSKSFPSTVHDVLWQSGQFFNPSCTGFYNSCLAAYDKGTIPSSCIDAAAYALSGNTSIEYNGQLLDLSNIYYFSRYRSDCKIIIQDHQFA